jgi:acid phosphatase
MPPSRVACGSILVLALVGGCASRGPRGDAAELPANDQSHALVWMQTSAEYQAASLQTYAAATRALREAVAAHRSYARASTEWRRIDPARGAHPAAPPAHRELIERTRAAAAQALAGYNALVADERVHDAPDEPLAVIVDVDETVLDNSPYQARLLATGTDYAEPTWDAWCEERRAQPIPGAVAYAQEAAAAGVRVYYVTNRKAHLLEATAANLEAMGFPVPADRATLLLRDDAQGHGRDKVSRRRLVDRTHRVVQLVGDALTDFVGAAGLDPEQRRARAAPYALWWGQRWFMLSTPTYGSWLDAAGEHCREGEPSTPRACQRGWLRRE